MSPTDAAVVTSHSCSSGDNNGANNNGNSKSMPKPSRTMKRALVGTVGAGLAAGAAVLLTNSDEFGEWLHVMAPHVMPAAGAGAEIVHRAIEASKVCFEEGVNICLDAEGHITLFCESLNFQPEHARTTSSSTMAGVSRSNVTCSASWDLYSTLGVPRRRKLFGRWTGWERV